MNENEKSVDSVFVLCGIPQQATNRILRALGSTLPANVFVLCVCVWAYDFFSGFTFNFSLTAFQFSS